MTRLSLLRFAAALMAGGIVAVSGQALAHGKVTCGSGPKQGWKSLDELKAHLIHLGWKISKAHPSKDCYEVYGVTPEGDKVESFWHPVTFEKKLVLRRGEVLYKAP